jgi:hypothetical protein
VQRLHLDGRLDCGADVVRVAVGHRDDVGFGFLYVDVVHVHLVARNRQRHEADNMQQTTPGNGQRATFCDDAGSHGLHLAVGFACRADRDHVVLRGGLGVRHPFRQRVLAAPCASYRRSYAHATAVKYDYVF